MRTVDRMLSRPSKPMKLVTERLFKPVEGKPGGGVKGPADRLHKGHLSKEFPRTKPSHI